MGYSHCGPVNIFTAAGAGRIKNKVKELRKARGLRQEDVAALLGVSRQTVNALALGMKLARLLETPVEELFTLEG